MIGRLTHFVDRLTATETRVGSDNIFVENGRFTATGLMENIAQTCAARIGYVNKYILKKGIQIGVIGAIRAFEVKRRPLAGQTICTRVEVVEEVFGMILAHAVVLCNEEQVASCDIKIAVKSEE